MRKVACLVVTVALFLGGGLAFGQDCGQLNITFKPEATDLDLTDYPNNLDPSDHALLVRLTEYYGVEFNNPENDWCWKQRVIGTFVGTWVSCGSIDLAIWGPLFAPLDVGIGPGPDLYGNPGIIHTRKGDIFTMSYGLSVVDGDDWIAFGGVTWYGDGTDAYEGATGWGTDAPKKYPPSYWIQSKGFLCIPD